MPNLIVLLAGKPHANHTIDRPWTRIGRSNVNDIVLDSPSVSSTHAVLILSGSTLTIEDLGSTNGTFLESKRIERADLEDGSTFSIGDYELKLVADAKAMAYEPTMVARSTGRPRKACVRRMDGAHAGEVIELAKVVNTIGRPGECIVTFIRRGDDYAVRYAEGPPPLLNGSALAGPPVLLRPGDILETDAGRLQFVLEESNGLGALPAAGSAQPARGPLGWLRRVFPRTPP